MSDNLAPPPNKKWNVLVTGNDGRPFYQNFHVIEISGQAAWSYLQQNFPYPKLQPTIALEGIEEMEDATWYLPGVVYKSGRAYFNADKKPAKPPPTAEGQVPTVKLPPGALAPLKAEPPTKRTPPRLPPPSK